MTSAVVDFHARLVPGEGAVGALVAAMDRAGVGRAVVSLGGLVGLDRLADQIVDGGRSETATDNEWIRRACAGSGGRLLPFFFADPERDVAAYRDGGAHFRGLEISPAVHGFGFDAPPVAALLAVAAELGHPVYVVCLGRPGTRAGDLVVLARAFLSVTFVYGHCGHIGVDASGLARIAAQPNIVAETSGCFAAIVALAVERLGVERVLFGTEYPLQPLEVELAKLAALSLTPIDLRKVTSGNASRLLGECLA